MEKPLRFWPEPVWAPGPFEKVELRDFDLTETEDRMTEDRLALAELSPKSGDPDFPRALAESVLQLIMEADVDGLIEDGRYERGEIRQTWQTWRNGYRYRTFDIRLSMLNLKIPTMRRGASFPPRQGLGSVRSRSARLRRVGRACGADRQSGVGRAEVDVSAVKKGARGGGENRAARGPSPFPRADHRARRG